MKWKKLVVGNIYHITERNGGVSLVKVIEVDEYRICGAWCRYGSIGVKTLGEAYKDIIRRERTTGIGYFDEATKIRQLTKEEKRKILFEAL